jgi:hypothetical protein
MALEYDNEIGPQGLLTGPPRTMAQDLVESSYAATTQKGRSTTDIVNSKFLVQSVFSQSSNGLCHTVSALIICKHYEGFSQVNDQGTAPLIGITHASWNWRKLLAMEPTCGYPTIRSHVNLDSHYKIPISVHTLTGFLVACTVARFFVYYGRMEDKRAHFNVNPPKHADRFEPGPVYSKWLVNPVPQITFVL